MRERTRRPSPNPVTTHLALQDGASTLCDEPLGSEHPSTVVRLYVPLERLQSLGDACALCRAVARRLQASTPVLTLRVVMGRPARLARHQPAT